MFLKQAVIRNNIKIKQFAGIYFQLKCSEYIFNDVEAGVILTGIRT